MAYMASTTPRKQRPAKDSVKTMTDPIKKIATSGSGDPRSVKPAAKPADSGYNPTKRTRKNDRFETFD
jgi:hypothetical protein